MPRTAKKGGSRHDQVCVARPAFFCRPRHLDRKSTRLNSSHANISYAGFCLQEKNIGFAEHFLATLRKNAVTRLPILSHIPTQFAQRPKGPRLQRLDLTPTRIQAPKYRHS